MSEVRTVRSPPPYRSWVGPQVELFEIVVIATSESETRTHAASRINIQFNGSVPKNEILQNRLSCRNMLSRASRHELDCVHALVLRKGHHARGVPMIGGQRHFDGFGGTRTQRTRQGKKSPNVTARAEPLLSCLKAPSTTANRRRRKSFISASYLSVIARSRDQWQPGLNRFPPGMPRWQPAMERRCSDGGNRDFLQHQIAVTIEFTSSGPAGTH